MTTAGPTIRTYSRQGVHTMPRTSSREAVLLLAPASFFFASLGDWGAIAAIVAAGATLLVLARQEGPRILRRLRRPFRVTFLVPRAKYPEASFSSAARCEQYPKAITVGAKALYHVMLRIEPNHESVFVHSVRIWFAGDRARPVLEGHANPMLRRLVTNELGDEEYIDWWGTPRPKPELTEPTLVNPGDPLIRGYRVRTRGVYDGAIRIELTFQTTDGRFATAREELPFRVSDSDDDLPFLKA
jgi:hypothetical protein